MKPSKYPRLRTKTGKGAGGQVWVSYVYDMRGTGKKDVRLGTDFAKAIEQWHKLHNHIPLTVGRIQEAMDRWRDEVLPQYPNAETRKQYTKQLNVIAAVVGQMAWHEVTLPLLRGYLDRRSAKTQGNREMAVLSIVWSKARMWGMTDLHWPAAGVKGWKNPEKARIFEVTDALFEALYAAGDSVLQDALDIATATGMRLTDVRTVRMPTDGKLRFTAEKTGKWAYFEVAQSPVLTELIERRGKMSCVMLLCTSTGRQVTESMLRTRYDNAREKAACANPLLADDLRAMYLRDSRKRAADLAEDSASATALLQHSNAGLVSKHYRTKATQLKAVR
jgi:hypothetical protein